MSTNFDTQNKTLKDLLGNGKIYTVPLFQRDYSWCDEQWEDLWLDILEIIDTDTPNVHYMAYLVLQKSDNDDVFKIIDGQQRLTTLSILILSILRYIQNIPQDKNHNHQDDLKRSEALRSTYIGALDMISLETKSKLNLNLNNDHYYQSYIVALKPLPIRGFKESEHRLRKASDWFDKKIDTYIKTHNIKIDNITSTLVAFVEKMAKNLLFTSITVTDQLNAYAVFETLNTRGVKLSSPDLLKNYLFSLIFYQSNQNKHEIDILAKRWTELCRRLEDTAFPQFLRYYWISHHKSVRKVHLFKDIKNTIQTRQDAYNLISGLENIVELYTNLAKPDAGSLSSEAQKYAKTLKAFSVQQFYVIILAAQKILSEKELTDLLHKFVVISFRYNIISSLSTSELETKYQKIALDITKGNLTDLTQIIDSLRSVYVSDKQFENDFKEAVIAKSKIQYYILGEIEVQQGGTQPQENTYSVEHILPQNAHQDDWNFSDHELSSFINRLGNLALLEKNKNNKIGNIAYNHKVDIFKQSCFQTTRSIPDHYAAWTIKSIESRQTQMAKKAKEIWKISRFS
ncbi:MAG: hypothetical protein ACJARD_000732 [Alphaproteobacteria bacterium]|jgi:hypothetical protein